MWDYSNSKIELDTIKTEIVKRNGKKSILKFAVSALLINFSLLFFEAINSRWEYFEVSSKKIWISTIIGSTIQITLFVVLGFLIYGMNDMFGRIIFEIIFLAFILPSVIKTFIDIKNYTK